MKRWFRIATDWTLQHVVLPQFTRWFGVGFMLLAPSAALLVGNGKAFFTVQYAVAAWAVALAIGFFLALSAWTVLTTLRQRARARRKWQWRGLEWELTPEFWTNLAISPYKAADTLVKTLMHGPFCARCKRPVTVRLLRNKEPCPHACDHEFDLAEIESVQLPGHWHTSLLDVLSFAAYVDAVGAARSGKI